MNQLLTQQLQSSKDQYQDAIERLLAKHYVQPVSNGYIDLILPREEAVELIGELAQLPVPVWAVSWWCLTTPASAQLLGCPHGLGGPTNRFGEGWFSEDAAPFFDVTEHGIDLDSHLDPQALADQCSQLVCHYITDVLPTERFYRECLHPGLWLYVPEDWQRQEHLV